jgi:hypothetical protein
MRGQMTEQGLLEHGTDDRTFLAVKTDDAINAFKADETPDRITDRTND